jgi:hypothetical protein
VETSLPQRQEAERQEENRDKIHPMTCPQ